MDRGNAVDMLATNFGQATEFETFPFATCSSWVAVFGEIANRCLRMRCRTIALRDHVSFRYLVTVHRARTVG